MTGGAVLDFLNDVERRLPVTEWVCQDLRIWPLVRIQLYFQIVLRAVAGRPDVRRRRFPGSDVAAQIAKPLGGLVEAARAVVADWRHNDSLDRPAEIVCLANTVDRTYVDGTWHDKIFDPFTLRFEEHGQRCLVLERTGTRHYSVPRHQPSVLIQPRLDLLTIRAATRGSSGRIVLDGHRECAEMLRSVSVQTTMPSAARIDGWSTRLHLFAGFFERVLDAAQARLGMTSNYFDLAGMAFVLACRRRHICSVEVQHGVQGETHAAYGRWKRVPQEGYELLPSLFWCWTVEDAAAVRRWSDAVPAYHGAVAGGNLWEAAWRNGKHASQKTYDEGIAAMKQRYPGEFDILLTLQERLYDPEAIRPVLLAIERTQRRWRWWIRQHPTVADGGTRLRRLLTGAAIERVIIEHATEYPLQALLPHMDVHVTHSSATVMEAGRFGVPSVVVSDYGEELFAREISAGIARSARSTDDIISAVDAQAKQKATLPDSFPPSVSEQEADRSLAALLHVSKSASWHGTIR